MGQIDHPDRDGSIEVETIDSESHRGHDMVQVQATDDDITLSDESGDAPWLFEDEVRGA